MTMRNSDTDINRDNMIARHMNAIKAMNNARQQLPQKPPQECSGLSDLQKLTTSVMNNNTRPWGFAGTNLHVKRQRLNDNLWKLTVENPKTRKIILEAEGHGDKIFAHEDNLARMAEALIEQGLKITTKFDY